MSRQWIVIAAAVVVAFAPVIVDAQMRSGMGDMTQTQGMMQQMGGMMQGGAMSPEQQKRMGELMQEMGGMMGMMHGMMGGMAPRDGTGPAAGAARARWAPAGRGINRWPR